MSAFYCIRINEVGSQMTNSEVFLRWHVSEKEYLMKCPSRQPQLSFLERHQALKVLALLYIFSFRHYFQRSLFHLKWSIPLRMQTAVIHSTASPKRRDLKGHIWDIFHSPITMKVIIKSKAKKQRILVSLQK